MALAQADRIDPAIGGAFLRSIEDEVETNGFPKRFGFRTGLSPPAVMRFSELLAFTPIPEKQFLC